MIVDTLNNLAYYASLNPLFADVVEFLKNNDLNTIEPGKYEIKGKDLFLNVVMQKGKTKEEAKLETHRNMLDIQIPITADETFGYTPLCDLPELEYNAEKDIIKYEGLAQTYFTCKPGQMAIFFPQDGHAPCVADVPEFKKAIFKIKA